MLRDQDYVGKDLIFGVRPEDIHDEPVFIEAFSGSKFKATVDVSELTGSETMVHSSIEGQSFIAKFDSRSHTAPGETLDLAFDMNKVHFFDSETELRIR